MKSFVFDQGGCNSVFNWGYIHRYQTTERIIWVCGNEFVEACRAVIDDFGNLVRVK